MKGDRDFLKGEENLHEKFASYIQALTGSTEPISLVWMEHSYARVWRGGGGTGGSGAVGGLAGGGARTLLLRRAPRCPDCHGEDHGSCEIDIETIDKEPEPPIPREPTPPLEKALDEDETGILSDKDDDWEEKIENLAPAKAHLKLLTSALECIRGLRIMRLSGAPRGAEHFARKLRRALASVWVAGGAASGKGIQSSYQHQQKPAAWLHAALSAYLPKAYLDCYIDIIAILKTKIPNLMEQMLAGNHVNLPAVSSSLTDQPVPLNLDDDGPLLVFIPSGRPAKDSRWVDRFKTILPVVRVMCNFNSAGETVAGMASAAVAAGRSRVLSLIAQKPNRRLVLIGHGAGAVFAAQVAVSVGTGSSVSMEGTMGNISPATGIVGVGLLAPPLLTWSGRRGMPDDCLLDLNCPTLIVVGQNAMQCDVEEAEAVRSRLRMWSRLVVVGAADDQLRLDYFKCTLEKVTQEMVECALADEVSMFVKSACQWAECPSPPAPPAPPGPPSVLHNEHNAHNGEESRPVGRRRAAGITTSNSPPHIKRQRHSDQPTTPIKDEDMMPTPRHSKSPTNVLRGDAATIQIGNTRMIRKFKNSTISTTPGKGIKILDSVCLVPGSRAKIPQIKRMVLSAPQGIDSPLPSPAPLTSTNIMDIPIIFADDDKQMVTMQQGSVMSPNIPIISPRMPSLMVSSSSMPTIQNAISVKRSSLSTPMKYSKVILAKRPATVTTAESVTTPPTMTVTTQATGQKVLGRPIIVRGSSGHLTAFRVMPGKAAGLVIKRANVISAANVINAANIKALTKSPSNEQPTPEESGQISRAETEMATQLIEKQTEAMSENPQT